MEDTTKQVPELVIIPLPLLNDILAYLGTKPYTEAANYIHAIQKQSKIIDKPVAQTEDKSDKDETKKL